MNHVPRGIAVALVAMLAAGAASAQTKTDWAAIAVVPLPAPVPATEARATLPDTRLWYWDTGGDGTPVVLVHPATGSGLIWACR